jgi:ATP-binding cassette, subfamily F, member 3
MEMHATPEYRTRLRSILGAFMFTGDDHDKRVSVLSGGERARLAMACLLLKPFNLLLLDEPTNHLDMISKEVLKEALMQYDGTMIIVSHDRDFLRGLTNRTIEFRDKKLYEHLGDVDYFLHRRQLDDMRAVEMKTVVASSPSSNQAKNPVFNEDKRRYEKVLQNAEKRIADLEMQTAELEKEMAKPDFYNRADSQKTLDKYNGLKKDLVGEMEKWEEATMALEG